VRTGSFDGGRMAGILFMVLGRVGGWGPTCR
jgi:hypothetical protein